MPPPLPANELPVTVPEKFGLDGNDPFAIVPLTCPAGNTPSKLLALLAKIAPGTGKIAFGDGWIAR